MKLILYMAMTINGMIAKEDGETPWSDEAWADYYKFSKQFKSIILGRKTFEIMKEVEEFDKIGNPFTIVVTSQKINNYDNFVFVHSAKEAIKILKERKVEKTLVLGGAQIGSIFMKENLIDEVILTIEPQIFGKGTKLFSDGDFEKKLEFVGSRKISDNVIQLHYQVNR